MLKRVFFENILSLDLNSIVHSRNEVCEHWNVDKAWGFNSYAITITIQILAILCQLKLQNWKLSSLVGDTDFMTSLQLLLCITSYVNNVIIIDPVHVKF